MKLREEEEAMKRIVQRLRSSMGNKNLLEGYNFRPHTRGKSRVDAGLMPCDVDRLLISALEEWVACCQLITELNDIF